MLPTADISDKYSESVSVLEPIFRDFGGIKSFFGKVVTLKTLDDNTKVREALESNGEGKVLVVDGQASLNCALLGGNLAVLASKNGWSGIIVNGCVRDQLEIKLENIGVKAINSHPKKSNKDNGGELGLDLHFANVNISEGDYIYADEDGIIISKKNLDI
jgi:regulator of ribonuclease activity A